MNKRKSALATAAILGILAIGSFVVLLQERPPTEINVSSANTTVGDTFSIKIPIDPSTAIAGAQCSLRYDSSIVTVNSVTEGNLFSQNGSDSIFTCTEIDNANGTVKWIWGNILNTSGAPKNVSTKGIFAVVSMTAKKEGHSPLELITIDPIAVKVCDSEGVAASIKITNGSVTVTEFKIIGRWRFGDEMYYCECVRVRGRW